MATTTSTTRPAMTVRRTYAGDYAFGKQGEATSLPKLNKYFSTEMVEQPRYAPFDFICKNNTIYFELKTRKCKHNTYPTLWINWDKVQTAKAALRTNPDRKYYFAFNLYDGIWFIQYNETLFDGFSDGWFQRTDRDTNDPPQHILNIPVEHLSELF
jgi:hypothetical protein